MVVSKISLHLIIEKDIESGWYTATCPALTGCVTQAKTEAELFESIREAVKLWFEVQDEKGLKARKASSESIQIKQLELSC